MGEGRNAVRRDSNQCALALDPAGQGHVPSPVCSSPAQLLPLAAAGAVSAAAVVARRELTPLSERRPWCLAQHGQRAVLVSLVVWVMRVRDRAPEQRQLLSLFGWWVPCRVVGTQIHQSPVFGREMCVKNDSRSTAVSLTLTCRRRSSSSGSRLETL